MADKLLGSFVWCELMTTDPKAAESFYGKVVGWTAQQFTQLQGATLSVTDQKLLLASTAWAADPCVEKSNQLKSLVEIGKEQGFLTFAQVNDYLPDEAVNPEKLDNLLSSLQELGLEIRVEADLPAAPYH